MTRIGYSGGYIPYQSVRAARGASAGTPVRAASIPAAQPDRPVQPVKAVPPVEEAVLDKGDVLRRLETDPAAMAVRGRIRYLDGEAGQTAQAGQTAPQAQEPGQPAGPARPGEAGQAPEPGQLAGQTPELGQPAGPARPGETEPADGEKDAGKAGESKSAQEVAQEAECQTCKRRKYQDGSDDPGVSFKTPSRIAPEQAASAVRGHEYEHVVRERVKAEREDRRVVSQSVTYHTDICPECGKPYVSGGETRTVTAEKAAQLYKQQEQNQAQEEERARQGKGFPAGGFSVAA